VEDTRQNVGWNFWLKWVGGTTLGWIVGFIVGLVSLLVIFGALYDDVDSALDESTWGFAIFITVLFTLGGLCEGFMQWLLLRRRIDHAGGWALAQGLGCATLAVLYVALDGVTYPVVNEVVHNAVGGAVTGLLQAYILRRYVARPGQWVALCAASFVLASAVNYVLFSLTGVDAISNTLGMTAMAALTGTALVRWLRSPALAETPDVALAVT
jgi:hypothetical protein